MEQKEPRPLTDEEREALRAWALRYVCARLLYLFDPLGEFNRLRQRLQEGL